MTKLKFPTTSWAPSESWIHVSLCFGQMFGGVNKTGATTKIQKSNVLGANNNEASASAIPHVTLSSPKFFEFKLNREL